MGVSEKYPSDGCGAMCAGKGAHPPWGHSVPHANRTTGRRSPHAPSGALRGRPGLSGSGLRHGESGRTSQGITTGEDVRRVRRLRTAPSPLPNPSPRRPRPHRPTGSLGINTPCCMRSHPARSPAPAVLCSKALLVVDSNICIFTHLSYATLVERLHNYLVLHNSFVSVSLILTSL